MTQGRSSRTSPFAFRSPRRRAPWRPWPRARAPARGSSLSDSQPPEPAAPEPEPLAPEPAAPEPQPLAPEPATPSTAAPLAPSAPRRRGFRRYLPATAGIAIGLSALLTVVTVRRPTTAPPT